ncbi:hypothetical protein [Hansschlegelia plantiphila]|uniref:hypothetical protein n=1 Tax=Hansschlegelia plantiphila TaxID=374655 RepID=UPI0022F24DCF|nr:hypothetical protein [Hansschlegelia plantiphila]
MGRIGLVFMAATAALVLGVAALVVGGPGRTAIPADALVVGQLAEPRSLDPATAQAPPC